MNTDTIYATEPPPTTETYNLDEVRRRRMLAFVFDYVLIAILSFFAGVVVFFLGIITLGLGWLLYGAIVPIVTLLYFGLTMGGDQQASIGMRLFSIRLEFLDGRKPEFFSAVLHTVLFWVGNMILPVVILFASLFSRRKRLLHDYLLGTVMVRAEDQ